jgi:hypothetical protein
MTRKKEDMSEEEWIKNGSWATERHQQPRETRAMWHPDEATEERQLARQRERRETGERVRRDNENNREFMDFLGRNGLIRP